MNEGKRKEKMKTTRNLKDAAKRTSKASEIRSEVDPEGTFTRHGQIVLFAVHSVDSISNEPLSL